MITYRRVGRGRPDTLDVAGQTVVCVSRWRRSAGTFATKREADGAWATAESDALLPVLEHTTRQRYGYQIDKYLLPEFGGMRMADLTPVRVREWITRLKESAVSASTIADVKTILSAIFTTALNDQVAHLHPCRGVKTPPSRGDRPPS